MIEMLVAVITLPLGVLAAFIVMRYQGITANLIHLYPADQEAPLNSGEIDGAALPGVIPSVALQTFEGKGFHLVDSVYRDHPDLAGTSVTVTLYGTKRYEIESISSERRNPRTPAVIEKVDDHAAAFESVVDALAVEWVHAGCGVADDGPVGARDSRDRAAHRQQRRRHRAQLPAEVPFAAALVGVEVE